MTLRERILATEKLTCEAELHPHVAHEKANLFLGFDGCSTELEVLEFLHGLVRLTKPARLLETGAFYGWGTVFLADACKLNGFGELTSVEINPSYIEQTRNRLEVYNLQAQIVEGDSLTYLRKLALVYTDPFELVFLDSAIETRAEELRLLLRSGLLRAGGFAAVHDTAAGRSLADSSNAKMNADLSRLVFEHELEEITFTLSRGLRLFRV